MIKRLLGIGKSQSKTTIDPTVFIGHERDENGIIISTIKPLDTVDNEVHDDEHYATPDDQDERREGNDRRHGPRTRRNRDERRSGFKFCLRKLIPFLNRRSGKDRRKEVTPDRRYGLDRRILKKLSDDEIKRLEGALPMHITDAFEKPSAKQDPVVKKDEFIEIHSGIARAPVYDKGGYFIAETFRKDPMFQEGGNNFVEFCNIPNSEMSLIFDDTSMDGMVACNHGEHCPLGLTKSTSEIIHFVINNEVTFEISDKVHRQLKLIKKANSDPTQQFVGLASKNEEKYFPIMLRIKNIGTNIQRISDSKVRFGNATIMYDGSQIIDVVDSDNTVFRLTGIAGLSNLDKYIRDLAKIEADEAKKKAAQEIEAEQAKEEEILETTIGKQAAAPQPTPQQAPDAIVALDVFGSAEKKIEPTPLKPAVFASSEPTPSGSTVPTPPSIPAPVAAPPVPQTEATMFASDVAEPKPQAEQPVAPTPTAAPQPAPVPQKPPSKPEFEAPMFKTPDE